MEAMVYKDLFKFLIETHQISQFQAAYQQYSSTVTQLIDIFDNIMKNLDLGKEILFTFCDVSKAFDKVSHPGLIHKLKAAGIQGDLLEWLKSYLLNRKHCTVVNGKKSKELTTNAGVPQGSVLGALLFILYMNDLEAHIPVEFRLYADDVIIFVPYENYQNAEILTNTALCHLIQWAQKWKVTFNATKTKSLNISRKNNQSNPTTYMNGVQIEKVEKHKHLGVLLQSNAKWSEHLDHIKIKTSKKLDILNFHKSFLDRRSLEKLYTAFIRPILEYAAPVWTNINKTQKEALENLNLRAARITTGIKKGTSQGNI